MGDQTRIVGRGVFGAGEPAEHRGEDRRRAGAAPDAAARLRALAGFAVLLMCCVDTVHAATSPPVPSLETISGSWIAVREQGLICRLVLDGPASEGEMVCVTEGREYRTDVSGIKLRGNELTVSLGSGNHLNGEVVGSKFAARYGRERINFFAEERILADLEKLGLTVTHSSSAPRP